MKINHVPDKGFKNIKYLLNEADNNDLNTDLRLEVKKIKEFAGTEDFIERISTFLVKRKTNYHGK